MPPWGTRPWHVLRASRSASSALWRLQTHRHPKGGALRTYAQQSEPNAAKTPEKSILDSAIIIPSSVSVTPEDLIRHIQPVSKHPSNSDRLAVFFLTPAFATWLLDDQTFVQNALTKLYQNVIKSDQFPNVKVHALCAVVDKLPTPQYIQSSGENANAENPTWRRGREPPVWDTGHEGMAYASLDLSDSVSLPQPAADEAGSISFLTSEGSEGRRNCTTLRLPLANTIFQTGLPTTMTHYTFENAKETSGFTLRAKENLTHHGLKLLHQKATTMSSSTLAIPLIPLCFPRPVRASMGNILRQISDGTPANQNQPASQELESLVPQFHKSRGEPSQAMAVWALVIPEALQQALRQKTRNILKKLRGKENSSVSNYWEPLWRSNPVMWNELVWNAIKSGARLHRVLSGGGGWGKKAGLLSLDPVITSTESESSASQKFSDQLDGPGDLSSALHPVAHPGDAVQFFVSPPELDRNLGKIDLDLAKQNELKNSSLPWQCDFGTIPSTIDALQATSWQHNPSDSNEVFVFRNSFGALAEGGMSVRRYRWSESHDSMSVVGGTKVDVPFSRFYSVDFPIEKKEGPTHNSPISEVFRNNNSDGTSITDLLRKSTTPLPGLNTPVRDSPRPRLSKQVPAKLRIKRFLTESPLCYTELEGDPGLILTHKFPIISASLSIPRETPPGLIRKIMPELLQGYTASIRPDTNHFQACLEKIRESVECMKPELHTLLAGIYRPQQQRQAKDTPIVPIRKIAHKTSESEYFKDRFIKIRYAAQDLGSEIRILMTSIRERDKHFHQVNSELIGQLENRVDVSDAEIYALQANFNHVLETISLNILDMFNDKSTRIETNVFGLRVEMAQILNFISARAHLIHLTNTSAIGIYNIHVLLRWRFAAMILLRQHKGYPMSQIMPFEKKLVQLRSFQSILFVYRDGVKGQHIRDKLDQLEQSNVYLRHLRLSEAAMRRHKTNRLKRSKAQTKEKAREIGLRRAIRGTRLKANHKIRYGLDKVPIRFDRRSSSPLSRRTLEGRLRIRGYESDAERGKEIRLLIEGKEARRARAGETKVRKIESKLKPDSVELKRREAKTFVETVSGWLGVGIESKEVEEVNYERWDLRKGDDHGNGRGGG